MAERIQKARDLMKRLKKSAGFTRDAQAEAASPEAENLNQTMRKKQRWAGLALLLAVVLVILLLHGLSHATDSNDSATASVSPPIDGILSHDFNQKNHLSALEQQQRAIDKLEKTLKDLRTQVQQVSQKPDQDKAALIQQINSILTKREAALAKKDLPSSMEGSATALSPVSLSASTSLNQSDKSGKSEKLIEDYPVMRQAPLSRTPPVSSGSAALPVKPVALGVINFHYPKPQNTAGQDKKPMTSHSSAKNVNNYVPAGTFATAVLLEGADANASVNGQSDTVGILLRILDRGTLPNGHHSHLKGCFVLASIYGDISSERGEARLTRLSCTEPDGQIIEREVQGYLSFAGKEGIKGHPVMRNGKILAMAGFSGMLGGFGASLSQASQTQSTSALGTTTTLDSNALLQHSLATGASSAMSQLANYYIQRADQYHPVIEIGSGTVATVIFQAGFSLQDEAKDTVSGKPVIADGFDPRYVSNNSNPAHDFNADTGGIIHDNAMMDLLQEAETLSPGDLNVSAGTEDIPPPVSTMNFDTTNQRGI